MTGIQLPRLPIYLVFIAALVSSSLAIAAPSSDGEFPEEEEMRYIIRLIAAGEDTAAAARLDEHYEQYWCRPALQPDSSLTFRFFADSGVLARRMGRLQDAASCVRASAAHSQNVRDAGAALFEASRVVHQIDSSLLAILVDVDPANDRPPSPHYGLFSSCSGMCSNEPLSILSCGWIHGNFEELADEREVLLNEDASDAERDAAFAIIQPLLSNYYLRQSFEIFPTPAKARRLIEAEVLTQGDVDQRVRPNLRRSHFIGFYSDRDETRLGIASHTLGPINERALELCGIVAGLDYANQGKDCYRFFLDSRGEYEVEGGSFEIFHAGLAYTSSGAACASDLGIAYLTFTDADTGRVSLISLPGEVGPNETCGSGGWGDHAAIEAEIFDASTPAIEVKAGYGALASKAGCGLLDMPSSGHLNRSTCHVGDDGIPTCLTHHTREAFFTEYRFPHQKIGPDGRLRTHYDDVDPEVWQPLEPVLNQSVDAVLEALPRIQERVLEAYR